MNPSNSQSTQSQAQPTSNQPQIAPATPNPTPLSTDAKISKPKYWLTVYGILAAIIIVDTYLISGISLIVEVGAMVLCYRHISRLKAANSDLFSEEEKYQLVVYSSIFPLLTQAFYYYRLRKTLPQTANIALKVGWKVLLLQLLSVVILIVVFAVLTATSALSMHS